MKIMSLGLGLVFMASVASAADVVDHYKNVVVQEPYEVEVCQKKTGIQGAVEGGLLGGLLGEAINGDPEALAIFGALVGANEAKHQNVCKVETRYNERMETIYTHSTVTFEHEGVSYTLEFVK